jgi:glycosyltransferase involved in cell wall biosynthesis
LSNRPSFFIASGCPIVTTTLYRCVHLAEQLRRLGHEVRIEDWFDEAKIETERALGYSIIVLYRLAISPALERLIGEARRLGKPVIFDTDDLVFEPELTAWHRAVKNLSAADQMQHLDGVRRYLATLLACDAAIVATPVLAELARKRGQPAFVHRNALGEEMRALADELHRQRSARGARGKIAIGYGSGTATHDIDFQEASQGLEGVLERFPQVELWITGPLTLPPSLERFSERIRHDPLTNWQNWFRVLSEVDIALAPLEMGNIFCRAKSEIKFVEAGALGLPVVASEMDPFRDAITPGKDGFLASNEKDWSRYLSLLVEHPELRARVGEEARRTVLRHYSPEARTADLANILPELTRSRSEQ